MPKYHVSASGNLVQCHAEIKCRRGGKHSAMSPTQAKEINQLPPHKKSAILTKLSGTKVDPTFPENKPKKTRPSGNQKTTPANDPSLVTATAVEATEEDSTYGKYHINSAGKAQVCGSRQKKCRFGGSDKHFDSANQAAGSEEVKEMANDVLRIVDQKAHDLKKLHAAKVEAALAHESSLLKGDRPTFITEESLNAIKKDKPSIADMSAFGKEVNAEVKRRLPFDPDTLSEEELRTKTVLIEKTQRQVFSEIVANGRPSSGGWTSTRQASQQKTLGTELREAIAILPNNASHMVSNSKHTNEIYLSDGTSEQTRLIYLKRALSFQNATLLGPRPSTDGNELVVVGRFEPKTYLTDDKAFPAVLEVYSGLKGRVRESTLLHEYTHAVQAAWREKEENSLTDQERENYLLSIQDKKQWVSREYAESVAKSRLAHPTLRDLIEQKKVNPSHLGVESEIFEKYAERQSITKTRMTPKKGFLGKLGIKEETPFTAEGGYKKDESGFIQGFPSAYMGHAAQSEIIPTATQFYLKPTAGALSHISSWYGKERHQAADDFKDFIAGFWCAIDARVR